MPRVILPDAGDAHVPIHVWSRRPPKQALEQLRVIARLPFVVEHVAAMPDLHVASGVAVGTVFATEGVVVPAALGEDLGCGMSAVRFDVPAARLDRRTLERLVSAVSRAVPLGDAIHRGAGVAVPEALFSASLSTGALQHARDRLAPRHLGTLGGGNHFLELDRDAGGDLWLLVHSGSRGLGAVIAGHHLRAAEAAGQGALPGLRCDTPAGRACLADLGWALDFARANREALLRAVAELVFEATGQPPEEASRLDVHHNFVREETHFARLLVVHRKGAIAAPAQERALIPGSMGTASYVVEGKGAPLAFASASHGAGRVLSRKEARARVAPRQLAHAMRRVVFDAAKAGSLVEEAPSAYRDLREVLEDEEDLVAPLLRLEPIAVVKG